MNLNFEKEIIDKFKKIAKEKQEAAGQGQKKSGDSSCQIIREESLDVLKGLKIGIDANILLAQLSSSSNPQKFIQEGGSSLDLGLQNALIKLIR